MERVNYHNCFNVTVTLSSVFELIVTSRFQTCMIFMFNSLAYEYVFINRNIVNLEDLDSIKCKWRSCNLIKNTLSLRMFQSEIHISSVHPTCPISDFYQR